MSDSGTMSSQTQQSGPLSDSDISVVREWVVETAIGFLLYGVNIIISFTTIYLLTMTRPRISKPQIGLLFLTIFMLLNSTLSVILTTIFILLEIPINAINPPDPEYLIPLLTDINIVGIFVDRLNFLASDGIVVWRAWVLFPHNLVVKITLVLCMIGSLAGTFVNAGIGTREFLQDLYDTGGPLEMLEQTLPLLITNLVATIMMGYKAWYYQRDIKKNLSSSGSSVMRVQKILWFLAESGFFYCMFWIVFTVISTLDGTEAESFQVYAAAMPLLSALYPVLIILIVAHEKSKDDTTNDGISLSQSIRFASAPTAKPGIGTAISEVESQSLGLESS